MPGVAKQTPMHVDDRAIQLRRSEREALAYRQAPSGEALLVMRWRRSGQGCRVLFMSVWLGFALFWTTAAAIKLWPWALLGLLFVAIGVRVSYAELSLLLNRTRLRIADGVLVRSEGPLPRWRRWHGPIADITEVIVEETADATRVEPVRNVRACLRSGEAVDLLCDVGSAEHAERWAETIRDELRAASLALPGRAS